jgi:urea transport system ATP-binding protein
VSISVNHVIGGFGRVLIGNPPLLLLDDPSEGVQPSIVQLICETLKSVRDELGCTVLFVEQNLDTIMALGERAYVIEKGGSRPRRRGRNN